MLQTFKTMSDVTEINNSIIYVKKKEFETMRNAVSRGINIKLYVKGVYNYSNNRYEVISKLSNQNLPEDPSELAAIKKMLAEMQDDMTAHLKTINNEETMGEPDSIPFPDYEDEPRNVVKKSRTVIMEGKRTNKKGKGWQKEIENEHARQAEEDSDEGEAAQDDEMEIGL